MQQSNPDTETFLAQFSDILLAFDYKERPEGHLPEEVWKQLVDTGMYLPVIPAAHGGRENFAEISLLLEKAAYHNLGLAMSMNIPTLLFLRNVMLYANVTTREEVLADLLPHGRMGGFAVIEPGVGSGSVTMRTFFEQEDDGYRITGSKHWQGFSGAAHWWLIAAKDKAGGAAGDKVSFFIHKRAAGGFTTTVKYVPIGITLMDYGVNELDLFVPAYRKLELEQMSFNAIFLLTSPSWGQWTAMGAGFLTRIYEEAFRYAANRKVPAGYLLEVEHVRYRLGLIAACRDVCRALLAYLLQDTEINTQAPSDLFPWQVMKVLAADSMIAGALHYQELCGGDGCRYQAESNFSAQAVQDAKGFAIFGGSNDMLYALLTHYCLTAPGADAATDLLQLVENYAPVSSVAAVLEESGPIPDVPKSNTAMVICGRILARLFAIVVIKRFKHTIPLETTAVIAATTYCKQEIAALLLNWSVASAITIKQEVPA
ncbi:acyl-CoA dehydrogenase family protein [Chitinophaga nivalis]|uniref:Acyl-CoA/acyl-ACP dehydrogenase n=1 Tax=Chitinophaga nivalis TaxID=2991709 RepID=A0ABT3IJD3_9BACT|nr:acyl-CoA dehydrogenase family protein [Chitinophaga nivalis]MCW3466233.1 acyl-CoA/acyl-ACP dehydrogenase [Chitinophaga nivalis]MCW3484076.1 acyl-CoA/acyl-ACP dehydrogenase [Chitinophaga nivalis]